MKKRIFAISAFGLLVAAASWCARDSYGIGSEWALIPLFAAAAVYWPEKGGSE